MRAQPQTALGARAQAPERELSSEALGLQRTQERAGHGCRQVAWPLGASGSWGWPQHRQSELPSSPELAEARRMA